MDCRCVLKRKSAPPRKRKTHNLRDFSNKKVYNQTLLLRRKCSNLEMAPKTNVRPKKSNSPNWKGNENKRKCKVCLCVYRMKIICSRHVYTYIRLIRDALQRKTERKRKTKKKEKSKTFEFPLDGPRAIGRTQEKQEMESRFSVFSFVVFGYFKYTTIVSI